MRVTGDGSPDDDLASATRAVAGDLVVTVVAPTSVDGLMRVDVELGGVDDADALDGFWLWWCRARRCRRVSRPGRRRCVRRVTVAEQSCALVFGTGDVDGRPRVLLLRRGEDQHRWALT